MPAPSITLDGDDLRLILVFCLELARKAGELILTGSDAIAQSSGDHDVLEKKNSVDLVTHYDQQVESLVKSRLHDKYPEFGLCVPDISYEIIAIQIIC